MDSDSSPADVFSTQLCPWLFEPYALLENAHREGQLGHGWLLTGPAGVGKLNLALAMANRLLNPDAAAPARLPAADANTAMTTRHEPTNHHPDLHWVFPEPKKRSISVAQIRQTADALMLTSLYGQAKIVTYCHKGVRSLKALEILKSAGVPNVRSLRGGIDAWSRAIDPSVPRY